ncbi:MAG TPA: SusC/RagA family TonB-linked outer membrane protein [Gemmatimonadaceae bacterium]|nr:SusC/RagA family TonB-linked outer membrane protein [Gemmatimonadaceae bacterium]
MNTRRPLLVFVVGALCGTTPAVAVSAQTPQAASITGRVTDAPTGQPLANAQIAVVGTNIGAQTNSDGQYTIRITTAGNYELRALRVGYGEQRRSVAVVAGQSSTQNFQMTPVPVSLNPVVTTATGQQRREEVGNDIAQVPAAAVVASGTVSNAADLLTSRAPGVTVFEGTQTGAGVRVRIRGTSSLSLTNNPIYVVDGVRVEGTTGSSSVSVGGTTPARINDINPEEIESIEVVKGPSASTLYGTDAANGVIVITTKRGVAGRPQWDYSTQQTAITDHNHYPTAYWGWRTGTTAATTSSPSNTVQCFLSQVAAGTCAQDSVTSYNLTKDPQSTPFGIGYRQQHAVGVKGGSEMIRYFIHGEWEDEDGATKVPQFDQRFMASHGIALSSIQKSPNHLGRETARANLDLTLSPDADLSLNAGYTQQDLRLPESDDSGVLGVATNIYGGPGFRYNLNANGDTLYGWRAATPRDIYQIETDQNIQRFIGSSRANWRPRDWLALRSTFGLDFIGRRDTQLCRFANCPDVGTTRLGYKIDNRTNFFDYTLDAAGTATKQINEAFGSRTTLGVQFTRTIFDRNGTEGDQLSPGAVTVTGAAVKLADEATDETRTLGSFIEQQVSFRDRLFVTGAIRSDRNSAFGADFKTVFYPKLSASWIVSQEGFFPRFGWLDEFRLRSAYGASGVQPGTIDAVPYYAATRTLGEAGEVPGVVFSALGNTNLKPERSTELEAGFDAAFWHNRISTQITYYNKISRDALVSRVLPPSLGAGTTSRFENLGEVKNSGWEAAINTVLLQSANLGWDVTFNGSTNQNKLVSLGGVPNIVLSSTQQDREKYPLNGWWSRPLLGFQDKNGNGIIQYNADPNLSEIVVGDTAAYLGNPLPVYEVAVMNGFDFWQRRFRLQAMIDYKGDFKTYNNSERIRCLSRFNCAGLIDPNSDASAQARTVAGREHPSRTVAGFIEDGDFIRFRELSLTFNAPERWAGRYFRSRSLAITGAVRNLGLVWTKYSGVDPEAYGTTGDAPSSFQAFAPPRYVTLRLNLGF